MDNHRDDHIVCTDCGTSFLFSAGEASVFQERGLSVPKRCKDCRRARKERGADGGGRRQAPRNGNGWNGTPQEAGPPRGFQGPRGTPRYTGEVNEYRSPMQDRAFSPPPWQPAPEPAWQPRRPQGRHDGEYRAPSGGFKTSANEYRSPSGNDLPPRFPRSERPRSRGGEQPSTRRPSTKMFPITCNACGAQAEVPFKPADGREVFCQNCYRARKPA